MKPERKARGLFICLIVLIFSFAFLSIEYFKNDAIPYIHEQSGTASEPGSIEEQLNTLAVKGRSPKTGYERSQFGEGWETQAGCDTRNSILKRDLVDIVVDDKCRVIRGTLHDKYTDKTISFERGSISSQAVQIDHIVALSDAWQKGAQFLSPMARVSFANDPLNLIATDGTANQQKSDGDAATWLPSSKTFRCEYVGRQVAVKNKYKLWVTAAEKTAIQSVLTTCPGARAPTS